MKITAAACLLSLIFLTSCGGSDQSTDSRKEHTKALALNQEKWELRNIKSYQYQLRMSCYCMKYATDEKQVIVFDGVITEAFFLQTSDYLTAQELTAAKTVDELFAIVAQAISLKADTLNVSYNKDYGYPETISIDYKKDAIDDEVTYYATNLM